MANSCYRSCAHGQSLLCLQLRVDEAYRSIQWKMTLWPRLCVKTADNYDKSYCGGWISEQPLNNIAKKLFISIVQRRV